MIDDPKTQLEKFKEAACDLECDEDEARWDATLKKAAKQKPAPDKPEEIGYGLERRTKFRL